MHIDVAGCTLVDRGLTPAVISLVAPAGCELTAQAGKTLDDFIFKLLFAQAGTKEAVADTNAFGSARTSKVGIIADGC